jgi:hypothetical protein
MFDGKIVPQIVIVAVIVEGNADSKRLISTLCAVAKKILANRVPLTSSERVHFERYREVAQRLILSDSFEEQQYILITHLDLLFTLYSRWCRLPR